MTQVLYSIKTEIGVDGDRHRITKFVDGEVESSYHTTHTECDCPAGRRPSCRHRQMLPQMIAAGIVNTHWFWDFDWGRVVDFEGNAQRELSTETESTPTLNGWRRI